jgi:hypothetical protein
MKINHKRLYEILTNDALIDELTDLVYETDSIYSQDLDKHYEKITMIKKEIIKRIKTK